jgi:hypothetical protein
MQDVLLLYAREFKKRKKDGQDVIYWDIYRDYAFNDGGIYHPSWYSRQLEKTTV